MFYCTCKLLHNKKEQPNFFRSLSAVWLAFCSFLIIIQIEHTVFPISLPLIAFQVLTTQTYHFPVLTSHQPLEKCRISNNTSCLLPTESDSPLTGYGIRPALCQALKRLRRGHRKLHRCRAPVCHPFLKYLLKHLKFAF